jgi:hypothetical protein
LFADAKNHGSASYLGQFLGGINRSTIGKYLKSAKGWEKVDPSVKKDINAIKILMERPYAFNIIKNILQLTPVEKMEELAQVIQEFYNTINEQPTTINDKK